MTVKYKLILLPFWMFKQRSYWGPFFLIKFLLKSKNSPLTMGSEPLILHVPFSIFPSCSQQEHSVVLAMHGNIKTYYIILTWKICLRHRIPPSRIKTVLELYMAWHNFLLDHLPLENKFLSTSISSSSLQLPGKANTEPVPAFSLSDWSGDCWGWWYNEFWWGHSSYTGSSNQGKQITAMYQWDLSSSGEKGGKNIKTVKHLVLKRKWKVHVTSRAHRQLFCNT